VKVLEHRYGKLVYVERSEGDKKFSAHFWAQRPNGWRLLHINDLEVRARDYQTVPTTFAVPCTNPCHVLPYKPLGAGEKSRSKHGRSRKAVRRVGQTRRGQSGSAGYQHLRRPLGLEEGSLRRDARAQQQNPNRPEIGAAPVAFGRAWDFGESVLWVQLQPTYGDKPYWSSRVYANINGLWQMAESYHTYIKDAPGDGAGARIGDEEGRDQLAMQRAVAWACCAWLAAASVGAQTAQKTHELKGDARHHVLSISRRCRAAGADNQLRRRGAAGNRDRNARIFRTSWRSKAKIPSELYETFKGVDDNGRRDHTLTDRSMSRAPSRAIRSRSACAPSICASRSQAKASVRTAARCQASLHSATKSSSST
jgi:hypothetical protein